MRYFRLLSATLGSSLAICAALGVHPPTWSVTTNDSASAPVSQMQLHGLRTRTPAAPWGLLREPVPSGFLAAAVLRQHTVRVVEVRARGQHAEVSTSQRAEVRRAIDILESALPDVRFRVEYTRPIVAPAEACSSPYVAWAAADKRVGERWAWSKPGRHVAALVNCRTAWPRFALAQTSGSTLGSGLIWSSWSANFIAHELGHTLGFWGHSGLLACDGLRIHPKRCNFAEYSDPVDLMGSNPLLAASPVVSGVWRDLIYGSREVPLTRASSFKLEIADRDTRSQPLRIASDVGFIYVDAGPAVGGFPGVHRGVYLRLAIKSKSMSGADVISQGLIEPALTSGQRVGAFPVYVEGNVFAVPGTQLIATVDDVAQENVSISFTVSERRHWGERL